MTTSKNNKISVLIVDDHPPLQAGVRAMLEKAPDICVIGEAGDGDEAKKNVSGYATQNYFARLEDAQFFSSRI